jgi:hypothetical protein
MLILKIILKNKKKYFNIFLNKNILKIKHELTSQGQDWTSTVS